MAGLSEEHAQYEADTAWWQGRAEKAYRPPETCFAQAAKRMAPSRPRRRVKSKPAAISSGPRCGASRSPALGHPTRGHHHQRGHHEAEHIAHDASAAQLRLPLVS